MHDHICRHWADSKTLTAEKRSTFMKDISADRGLGYAYEVLSAELISNAMLAADRTSLNTIAADSTIKLIRGVLEAGVQVKEVGLPRHISASNCYCPNTGVVRPP